MIRLLSTPRISEVKFWERNGAGLFQAQGAKMNVCANCGEFLDDEPEMPDPFRRFCQKTECGEAAALYREEQNAKFHQEVEEKRQKIIASGLCPYYNAWVGHCAQPTHGQSFCPEHLGNKCSHGDGNQADHACPQAASLVCGAPCCTQHAYCPADSPR